MHLQASRIPVTPDTGAAILAHAWVSPAAVVVAADDQHLYEINIRAETPRPHHLTPTPLAAPVLTLAAFPLSAIADRISAVGTGQECVSMVAAGLGNGTLQLFKLKLSEDSTGPVGSRDSGATGGGGGGGGGESSGRTVKILGVKTISKALSSPVSALCWMADASALVVGCEDGSLVVFSPSGEPRAQFSGLRGSSIRTLAASKGDSLIIGTTSGLYGFQLSSAQTPVILDPGAVNAVVAVEETGSMLVSHDDGRIHCIGPGGNLLWVTSLSGVLGSGVVAGGMLGTGGSGSMVGGSSSGGRVAGRALGVFSDTTDLPTAIAAAPDGSYALVGSQEGRISLLSLANPVIMDELRLDVGGVLGLSFAPGGYAALMTSLCNTVVVIYVSGQRRSAGRAELHMSGPTTMELWDESINPPVHEEVETGSPISTIRMGFGHAVAITRSFVYSIEQPSNGSFQSGVMLRLGTTSPLPMGESTSIGLETGPALTPPPHFISLGEGAFAVGDAAGLLHTFSYDLRPIGKFRHNSWYSSRSVAVSGGVVACVDAKNPSVVGLFSTSGKKVGGSSGLRHIRPVSKVVIGVNSGNNAGGMGNGSGSRRQRLVVVLDVANEAWAYEVTPSDVGAGCRLGIPSVYDVAFVEGTTALLLVTQDGLALHLCPTAALIDPGLTATPIFGVKRLASPMHFRIGAAQGPSATSGAFATLLTSPSSALHCRIPNSPLKAIAAKNSEELLGLCRAEPSAPLWALAALIGASVGDLAVLRAAYSALSLLTRVRVVAKAQASDNTAEREAFVRVLTGDTEKALNILLANSRHKVAVQLCLDLFMQDRAEQIARDSGDAGLVALVKGG